METIKWGILSTGNIAHSFAQGLQAVPDAELVAVGSRSQQNADEFAHEYDIPHAHSSYQALADDPDVDVIYIATPHPFHAENTIMCLTADKHVLCEKPFTLNAQQAQECINLAQSKNLFLMEAVWMRFLPATLKVKALVLSGIIGDVTLVQADFSFYIPFDADHRLFDPELGGGALLDVGIYPLSFTTYLLGMPQAVQTHARMANTGVDEQVAMLLTYENGTTALLSAGIAGDLNNQAVIKGTQGTITVHAPFFCSEKLTLQRYGNDPQVIDVPFESNGYNYEAQAVHDCLRNGQIEHPYVTHAHTLAMMALMDEMRQSWGLKYPHEE